MRQCIGGVIICFPRWTIFSDGNAINLVGEYQHYEGAVAVTLGLPLMIIAEDGVENLVSPGREVEELLHTFPTMPSRTGLTVRSSLRDLLPA